MGWSENDPLFTSEKYSTRYYVTREPGDYVSQASDDDELKGSKQTKCCMPMVVFLIIGAVLAVIGAAMAPVVDYIIREQIKERVVISEDSETFEIWQDVPIPVYMQFYMFNIGDAEEVMNGETPYLHEVGPFTYREQRVKFDIVWNDNGTVTYREKKTYHFVREMSVADEDTQITTINPFLATIVQNFKNLNDAQRTGLSFALGMTNEDIIMTRSVKEVLWGYDDRTISFLHSLNPDQFPKAKVGYFIRKNDTDDGLYTVYTGESDIEKLALISKYNGADKLDLWTTPWANMVNGTDGTVGPPFQFDKQAITAFVSDICRSAHGVYTGDTETRGIELRRFGGFRSIMENATEDPDNIGFCTPQTNCLPSGLLNSTLCQKPVNGFRPPVIFSFPHFLYADPRVQQSVVGLNPIEKEHETVLDQEPWTGLVLRVAKRFQINMYVQKVDNIRQTHDIQTLFFPIMWLNESAMVDDHWANKLKDELFFPMKLACILKFCLLFVGSLLIMVAVAWLVWMRCFMAKQGSSGVYV